MNASMKLFDMPLEELEVYKPERDEPADFDAFWAATLRETRQHPLNARFEAVDFGLQTVETYDVTFAGYGGQPIKGWFLLPRNRREPLPCVVEYIGYGGGRGFPTDWLVWSSVGFAHFIMDTRGQGSTWRKGDTPDIPDGANPFHPGFMTQGILDPKTYYYRRVFSDAVRAVEAARTHPAVNVGRIAVCGGSQGGGITLAVSGLISDEVAVAMPDVAFLCHFRRVPHVTDAAPYVEITRYCQIHRDHVDRVFETLSYFDGMNFAARAKATALFSVGLMDQICPPSTVYAAYNHYGGKKDIRVWQFNHHEGGNNYHTLEQIKFLTGLWRGAAV